MVVLPNARTSAKFEAGTLDARHGSSREAETRIHGHVMVGGDEPGGHQHESPLGHSSQTRSTYFYLC